MFNSLTGHVDGHDFPLVFLRTGGIEWELEVGAQTFQAVIAADRSARHRLYVHVHTREDILKLYGFWTVEERGAFRRLLTVSGIGPRQALRILSGTTVTALTELLDREDVTALTRIPGLGRKTAQKMILQLKGHLVSTASSDAPTGDGGGGPHGELVSALVDMGFDRGKAGDALTAAAHAMEAEADVGGEASGGRSAEQFEQELFRRAIVALSGS